MSNLCRHQHDQRGDRWILLSVIVWQGSALVHWLFGEICFTPLVRSFYILCLRCSVSPWVYALQHSSKRVMHRESSRVSRKIVPPMPSTDSTLRTIMSCRCLFCGFRGIFDLFREVLFLEELLIKFLETESGPFPGVRNFL